MHPSIRNNHGFTWVELIIVTAILGIISAVVVGSMMSSDTELAARSEVLKTHIRYAQSRSMSTQSVWYIKFLTSSSYSLYRNGDAVAKLLPGGDSPSVSLPSGMSVNYGASDIVSFDEWGKPYTDTAGQTVQATNRVITIADSSGSRIITITKNTGFIQ